MPPLRRLRGNDNKPKTQKMKKTIFILLFLLSTCTLFAQDSRIALFLRRANRYASVELSDYRRSLRMEYDV